MRIVIDARESGTSTGRYVDKLIEYLHKLGPKHDMLVLTKPERAEAMRSLAPGFTVVESPYKEFTFSEQLGLKKQIAGLEADLVHFAMPQQPVLYDGKTVTTIHDLTTTRFYNPDKNRTLFWFRQQVYKWVIKRVAQKSVKIITPSQFVKNDLLDFSHIAPEKITVTYEAADPITDAPTPLPDLQNKQFIMYVGRPTPHKNLERLVKAFRQLQANHPSLHLVLAGKKDKNYERIENLVREGRLTNVLFTDFVSEGQLRWLYEHCAAYVFPSLSEGFGLPGLEAMLHGAPVVSSDATCLPEIYGDAAHYFDPTDVQAMSSAIDGVLTSEKLRNELIAEGRAQAEKYSWQRMAEETLAVYDQALDQ
jgi:glycosyltransferase involved in cell wall biosynthesis